MESLNYIVNPQDIKMVTIEQIEDYVEMLQSAIAMAKIFADSRAKRMQNKEKAIHDMLIREVKQCSDDLREHVGNENYKQMFNEENNQHNVEEEKKEHAVTPNNQINPQIINNDILRNNGARQYSDELMKLVEDKGTKKAIERIKMGRQRLKERPDGITNNTEWKIVRYNNGIFEGEVIKGTNVGEGMGIYILNSGNVFEGWWKNDKQEGYGEYFWNDGRYYCGEWREGKGNGYGVDYYQNGNRYEGDWKDGKQHGSGTFYKSDGGIYIGEYINDKREGLGTLYYSSGNIEVGQWKDGQQIGEHIYTKTNGKQFKRIYDNGKKVSEQEIK